MTRGRKKLPQEILDLRGTDRPDRRRPSSTIGTPVKVDEIAQRCQVSGLQSANQRTRRIYWAAVRRVASLGMMQETFCTNLLLWARDIDMLIEAEGLLEAGLVIPQGKKTTTTRFYPDGTREEKVVDERVDLPNPAFKQHMTLQEKILKIGSLYGFSPRDVMQIKIQAEDKGSKLKGVVAFLMADEDAETPEEQ